MYERAEVNYRETQYGYRVGGEIRPANVGPAEAKRAQEAGIEVHKRNRTVYYDDVSEWTALPADQTDEPKEGDQ